jgi:beta-glucanase (GH16 family)
LSQGENLILTMAPDSVGTVVSSAFEVFYGKVSATMRTSRGAGAVTAFILFSDAKDEIDYEWVGADLNMAQTNYYFQGIPDCKYLPSSVLSVPLFIFFERLPNSRCRYKDSQH